MEAKGSLERMRDGCNYVEIAGGLCYKCGKVHGEPPTDMLLDAARRNVALIRNRAREAYAECTSPCMEGNVVRDCDALLINLESLGRDIESSSMRRKNR